MAVSSATTRLIAIGRVALPWLIGPVALMLRGRPLELTPASACPGLLELVAIGAFRTRPDLSAGILFGAMHALFIVAGLGIFAALVYRATGQMAIAAATGLAIGLSPAFASTLGPPWEAAAFAVYASIGLLTARYLERPVPPTYARTGILAMLTIAGLIVPTWLILAALGAGMLVFQTTASPHRARRWLLGGATATGIVCVTLVVLSLSPPNAFGAPTGRGLASCVLPLPTTGSIAAIAPTLGWLVGPFALALCLLGIFVETQRAGWRRSLIAAAIGLACVVPAAGATVPLQILLSPWVVALWWLAASGLREIVSTTGGGPARSLVAVLLLVLMPALQTARVNGEERDDRVRPNGHENATLRHVTAVLNSVSPDAIFVEEDASIDGLLRAAVFGGRRTGKHFTVLPPQPAVIRRVLDGGAVYVFPRGRADLSVRGFTTEPVAVTMRSSDGARAGIAGIAAVTGFRPCQVVARTWMDLLGGSASGRIAIVADSEAAQGPLTIFLGGSNQVEPAADGWPPRTTRGFRFAVFDQRQGKGSDRLGAEARELGLPAEHPVLSAPVVVRLTLHRTPRAPLALAVALGAPFPVAVAKLQTGTTGTGELMLCDAPAVDIAPFGSRVN